MSAQGWTAVPHSVARSSNLSMVAKVVYLAIASRADGTGVAWPSRKTIAADAGVSLPSVERALPELREAGLLSWEQTVSASGIPHGTSRDRITAGAPLTDVPLPPAEVPVPLTDVPPTSHRGTGASHRGTEEQPIRTPKKNMSAHAHDAHPDAHFDAFWDAYPRKVGKGRARPAWTKALKTTDAQTILDATTRFAAEQTGTDPKFIPHPTSWLNGERWTDEPAPAFTPTTAPPGSSIWDKRPTLYEEDIA